MKYEDQLKTMEPDHSVASINTSECILSPSGNDINLELSGNLLVANASALRLILHVLESPVSFEEASAICQDLSQKATDAQSNKRFQPVDRRTRGEVSDASRVYTEADVAESGDSKERKLVPAVAFRNNEVESFVECRSFFQWWELNRQALAESSSKQKQGWKSMLEYFCGKCTASTLALHVMTPSSCVTFFVHEYICMPFTS